MLIGQYHGNKEREEEKKKANHLGKREAAREKGERKGKRESEKGKAAGTHRPGLNSVTWYSR